MIQTEGHKIMAFIPSPQQAAFFDWALNGKGNAFVEAVAGAGKTTSLMECTNLLMKATNDNDNLVMIVAYSKAIARELSAKIKARGWFWKAVQASTFHSAGWKAWTFRAKGCKLNEYKTRDIMGKMQIPEGYESFIETLVSLAKNHVLDYRAHGEMMDLVHHHNLQSELDKGQTVDEGIEWASRVLKRSDDLRYEQADYDDMIYLPVKYDIRMFQYKFVMVDEAQDTNPARRMMAAKMVAPGGRAIFVGDRHQAIFGFTGADSDAVDLIIKSFNCTSLPLTVTYRCPKSVVSAAQAYVSHIEAHATAPEGEVIRMTTEQFKADYSKLLPTDAILCRKTAPLVSLAYELIRKGIPCHVEGRDIGKGLKKLLTRWKVKTIDAYMKKLDEYERTQVERFVKARKETAAEAIKDRCATIRILADGCADVACMVAKVDSLFGNSDSENETERERFNNLTLSTVHKSKGREWGNVYVLGFSEYMPSPMAKQAWEKQQENNLIYVAFTRAQSKLALVG